MSPATQRTPLIAALEQLGPHDHFCSIYENREEHYGVAIPFMQIGLDRGEKCIYIADDGMVGDVRQAMQSEGIDVERATASKALVLATKEQAYLRHGSFNPDWMFTFWKEATQSALSEGFSALRATGETEWVVRGARGLERWMEYESRLTHAVSENNCSALCQYNRCLFPPELILDVIRTHPVVVYRGTVCRNMYHVPPDEFLGTNQTEREVERLLTNICEREEIEYALRKQRSELQHSFDQLRALAARLQKVREEERTRVAREIHDELGQELTAIKIDLSSLVYRLPADKEQWFEPILKLVDQTILSVRRIATELRPGILDDLGLVAAVEWAAEEFEARTRTKCQLDLPQDDIDISQEPATALFRIFQET